MSGLPPWPWWRSAVVYQVYPRSFCDSDGDGVGDLEGVRRHLDHLVALGVDALWLSPIYRSPMADAGYDVADHCDVDPLFGTLADFDRLLAEAHGRGLKVVLDYVPNHTSDRHPWFLDARSSRTSPKRDWYVWRDGTPERPPNNWRAAFADEPAWTWDAATGAWYLRSFLPEQPELDWSNPEVVEAMHAVVRFWLDRGVDGFRVDVIQGLGKDPALPDVPADLASLPTIGLNEHPLAHERIRELRRLLDAYPGDRVMVGEVSYFAAVPRVAEYYGDGDEVHLAFNFPALLAPWDAGEWRRRVEEVLAEFEPRGAWPSWVLSNHDVRRHRTRYGSEARARAAAVLLLTLRGTPFLYAGEELGLEDAEVAPERRVDPGGRDGCRAPLPWDPSPAHGWASAEPWLPWPPEADTHDAATERDDPDSTFALYRRLLAARRASPALTSGAFSWLAAPDAVLAYERREGDDRRVVLVNFAPEPCWAEAGVGLGVEAGTDRSREGTAFDGHLGPDEALILR